MHGIRASHAFDGHRFVPGGATVLIDDGRIVGVEPAGFDPPSDVLLTSYDGTVLPGLVDAHVHLVSDASIGALERAGTLDDAELDAVITGTLRQQARAGVTTVRDLGDTRFRTLTFRDRPVEGQPRIVAAGPPLTTPKGHCFYLGGVVDPEAGVTAVIAEHLSHGVDVIKVMASGGMLTVGSEVFGVQFAPAQLRAIVDRAHESGLQVLAHAHSLAGIEHAVAAGVDGIEHFSGITADGLVLPDELLERVATAGITVDPTMGNDMAVLAELPSPPPQLLAMMERLGIDIETFVAERYVQAARLREHGVRVVPGVDAGAGPLKAHGNQWRCVVDLVTAGWTMAEALVASTSGAADACGLAGVTGRLAEGFAADVLVVDGDPSTDPEALSRPVEVLVRGISAYAR